MLLRRLTLDARWAGAVTHVEALPPRPGRTVAWPAWVDPLLVGRLRSRGIERPWEHQAQVAEHAWASRSVVVATGTASGKSLDYLLPVLTRSLSTPASYRGVFGSHVAQVLRRLGRVCARYGAQPTFVLATVTVADPASTATRLTGLPVEVVDDDASSRGPLTFALYEPPLSKLRGEHGAPWEKSRWTCRRASCVLVPSGTWSRRDEGGHRRLRMRDGQPVARAVAQMRQRQRAA